MMERTLRITLFCVFALVSQLTYGQKVFRSHSSDQKIADIFHQYPNLDSVAIIFTHDQPFLLYLDEAPAEGSINLDNSSRLRRMRSFYMLGFESDQFFLKRHYQELYEFIFQKRLISKINKDKDKEYLQISLTREGAFFRALDGPASPGAHFNKRRKQVFFDLLNTNLSAIKTPVVDSLLIIQAIVETDGWLLEPHEILYGTTGPLYDYFFKIYTDFFESKEKYLFTYGLFMPKIEGGTPRRGLIDIYIRLNPDNTITMSAVGDYRKLMIKNYKKDPNNPVFEY
ncbi:MULTISPECIES: hypothetical protein [unclassified Sphingobacterium]|uniref:hypothetical protein n=1 Tax=unclassified Sphingobacterium TaxID=2609468 RepID=UPI0025FC09C6|nr:MULTISPECIES: hypothetical protein [unclassified Sphingobacterium]